MYEEELRQIIEASEKNALTFFVGAGVSALSSAPDWKGLINAFCGEIGRKQKLKDDESFSSDEYLQIPQMYYYSINKDDTKYMKFVKDQMHLASLRPNPIHSEMLKLTPASFITTNYDTLLEDAAVQYCQSFKVVSCDKKVPTIFGDRAILKMHGDFESNNIVLKEEDYLGYSEKFKLIETLVKSIFATNTVVFIGYSINDYNIKLILNWTKALLGSEFRKPIFIRASKTCLKDEEKQYHESRGLSVVECIKLAPGETEYLPLYQSVFDALKKMSDDNLDGLSEEEGYNSLYMRLQPLDQLFTVRVRDVYKKLGGHVKIGADGEVYSSGDNCILLKKFYRINQMTDQQRNRLPPEFLEKYETILSVFKKARIHEVNNKKRNLYNIDDIPFADQWCISYDYAEMRRYISKKYTDVRDNYRKAFYQSRLKRYDEALFLFSDVSKEAYKKQDFLLYYLAKSNCISLCKALRNLQNNYGGYDQQAIDNCILNDAEEDKLFYLMPVEFRNEYDCLKDIYNASMLFEYSYEAFMDGQKVQKAIELGTFEWGLTSSDRAVFRINDYLHFLLGNGIVATIFDEYRNTVKNLLSTLVYKYSTRNKKVLHAPEYPFERSNSVTFDEKSFFCFVECFDAKEIQALFSKHDIESIEFVNMNLIEESVKSILSHYEYSLRARNRVMDFILLQKQIGTCMSLLGYVNISSDLVDKFVAFILSHDFREISYNDKRIFLISQLNRRKMYSSVTDKYVEKALIGYIDLQMDKLLNKNATGKEVPGRYCELIYLISPSEKEFVSRKLSIRIAKIMENGLCTMYQHIAWYYCDHITEAQKKRLVDWAARKISEEFHFDLFAILVHCNTNICKSIILQAKAHLWNTINVAKQENSIAHKVFPAHDPYNDLKQVGLWCFNGELYKPDFEEYLGVCPLFDFLFEQENFDFRKFEVPWLFTFYRINKKMLVAISENDIVRKNIREIIAGELKITKVDDKDKHWLQEILVDYFC